MFDQFVSKFISKLFNVGLTQSMNLVKEPNVHFKCDLPGTCSGKQVEML